MSEEFWINVACVVSAVVLTAAFLVHFVVLPIRHEREKAELREIMAATEREKRRRAAL